MIQTMANVSDIGEILPGVVKNFGTNWSSVVLDIPPSMGGQATGYIYKSGSLIKFALYCFGSTNGLYVYSTVTTSAAQKVYNCGSTELDHIMTPYLGFGGSLLVQSDFLLNSFYRNINIQYVVYR